MKQWYVIYTHPREEAIAAENLVRQGYETYYPRYRKRVSHARRVQEVAASLFPRYLFVSFNPDVYGWLAIRSTRGVVDVIRHGHVPSAVPAGLVEDIRAREDLEGRVVLGRQVDLQKGQPIRLQGDAFSGQALIFDSMKDHERVVALLTLLGREFRVTVPVASVVPV